MNKRYGAGAAKKQLSAFEKGSQLLRAGKVEEAEALYRRFLAKNPSHAGVLNNLGVIEKNRGNYEEAIRLYDRILASNPGNANALANKGNLLQTIGRYPEAISVLKQAVSADPKHTTAMVTLGWCYVLASENVAAARVLREALALDPKNAIAWQNLGAALYRQGLLDEAIEANAKALQLDSSKPVAVSNQLFIMHFSPRFSMQELFNVACHWAEKFERPLMPPRAAWPQKTGGAEKRLRVGFVSGDFRRHPVSYFFASMLEARQEQDNWDPILYADAPDADDVTERLAKASLLLRNVAGKPDDALAAQIRADEIDVLFDLTGHTGRNRLLMFARKPAPVQATWIGYFDTTGMETMDFLLADPITIPLEMQRFYRERIIHMPEDFLCYDPPEDAPEVAPLPALRNGYITFGSANQITKITPEVVVLWAAVVNAVPGAKLALKAKALGDKETCDYYRSQFEQAGLARERLELHGPGTQREMLEFYHTVDVGLDPFPCAGGTTTCEALWMGVPVVTLVGERFCNRHSASHVINAGIRGTVARTPQEYLTITKGIASDIPALARMRPLIRPQMAKSPLCDAPRFARNFAQVLRNMWVAE